MKKVLIYGLVIALVLTGAIGVFAVISGEFSALHAKILITTASVFFYSIIGLCCNTLVGGKYEKFGYAGIIAAVLGLSFAIFHTWTVESSANFGDHLQLRGSLFFIGIAFAHASLMLLIEPKNMLVQIAIWIALACNLFFTLILINQIIFLDGGEAIQIQVILGIINVVATLTAPLVNKLS